MRYELDRGGHRIRKVENGEETRYGYRGSGRLLWEEGPGGRVEYQYDPWGNLVERRAGATVEAWQYEFWPTGERRA
ncbi:MAG TPA: hypothetical protein VNO22_01395, partial [Planctomycetota bacterium]|nr:hypothetical protein [Planctomycetota bacterium]